MKITLNSQEKVFVYSDSSVTSIERLVELEDELSLEYPKFEILKNYCNKHGYKIHKFLEKLIKDNCEEKKDIYHPSILPTPKRTLKDRRQAATARPCPTTCSPRATAYVRSVSVHQILHTARRRLQSGKRQGNAHRAPTRPTMGFALTACWDFRRSLGAIQSQLLL